MRRCPSCGEENGDRARFCQACATPARRGGGLPRGAPGRVRPVRRPRRASPRGPNSSTRRTSAPCCRATTNGRGPRSSGSAGWSRSSSATPSWRVFGAPVAYGDDPERAVRAALAVRDAIAEMDFDDPLLELQTRAGVNTGEAVVELRGPGGDGRRDGGGRRREHGLAAAVQRPRRLGRGRRRDLRVHPHRHRLRAARADGRQGQGRSRPRMGRAPAARAPRGSARSRRCRSWAGARSSPRSAGRGTWCPPNTAPRSSRCSAPRGSGSRGWRTSSRTASRPPAGSRCAAVRWGTATPVRTARSRSTSRSSPARTTATTPTTLSPSSARGPPSSRSLRIRPRSRTTSRSSRACRWRGRSPIARRSSSRRGSSWRPSPASARRCWSSRTCTSQTRACWTCSSSWPRASRTCRCCWSPPRGPELLSSRPTWGGGLPASSTLSLGPLNDADAVELTGRLFAQRGLDDLAERAGTLAASSDGNPLVHRGAHGIARGTVDARPRAGYRAASAASSPPASTRCPSPSAPRSSTRRSSGKVFWRGALERLRPDRSDLSPILGSLERRDLIRREASSRIKGEQQYAFKHGLIREVAYLTLPREERRRCHRATAEYLEEVTLRAGDADATLAHHWREAGESEPAPPITCSRRPSSRVAAGRGREPSPSTGRPWSWSPRTPPS